MPVRSLVALDRKALNRVRIQQDGGSSNRLAAPIRAEGTAKGGSRPHEGQTHQLSEVQNTDSIQKRGSRSIKNCPIMVRVLTVSS